jgi:hypothetical protein
VQLCYVLPLSSLNLLPPTLYQKLIKEHPDWYASDCAFVWAYARYFWEAHCDLPELDIKELEEFLRQSRQV